MKLLMKFSFFTLTFILMANLNSCSSANINQSLKRLTNIEVIDGCPEGRGNISCSFEIIPNSRIQKSTEEVTGKIYPEILEDDTRNVIKFIFDKNPELAVMDGQYREEIMFDLPKNTANEISFTDRELSEVNFLFGRFCFCERSQVGYFEVDKGNLSVSNEMIEISFENTDGLQQIIKNISGRISAK